MKSAKKIFSQIIAWTLEVIAVMVCLGIAFWSGITSPLASQKNENSVRIAVPKGSSVKKIALEMEEKGLIRSKNAFYFAARFNLYSKEKFSLKSGVYTIKNSMSVKEIYKILLEGKQEIVSVSIAEGLTVSKIAALLEEEGICRAEDFKASACDPKWTLDHGINASSAEGFLFPDTYYFTADMNADDVVEKMTSTFFEKIKSIEGIDSLTSKQLFDLVKLASIVEREYRVADEAPLIASVFKNRLKINQGLQSCATIEYIITEIEGKPHPKRITYDDLEADSPYNTYKWAGLPPGPISNPGIIALTASAHPAKTDYRYFVLTNPEEGRHTFSKDFNSHIKAENGYYTK